LNILYVSHHLILKIQQEGRKDHPRKKFGFYKKFVGKEIKNGKGKKQNHISLDTPENMGQEKIIKKTLQRKEISRGKNARESGNNAVQSPTRKW
jgi:2-oxoglutarate dehydrogenase complex dehydrogenase (E1) component-like enzyme